MVESSVEHYIFLRTSIFCLQAVAPLCFGYICLIWMIPSGYRLPWPFTVYAGIECLFYCLIYYPRKLWLQKDAIHPPLADRAQRRQLFDKCHSHISDPEQHLSKWFHHAPWQTIKRGNVKQFLHWAFFDGIQSGKEENGIQSGKDENELELEDYVQQFEGVLGRKLEPGFNDNVKCLRLTMDPVHMSHRSALWYAMVLIVDLTTSLRLSLYGFELYPIIASMQILPPRPQTVMNTNRSPAKNLSYWHRPHRSSTKLPIVFIHGIGIGLWPYIPMLSEIVGGEDADVGIVAIEVMPISMRICHEALASAEFCKQVEQIVKYHKFDKFVLMAHSYGTALSTQLLRSSLLLKKIDSVLLIDPVSFLLHLPNVAYNFVGRKPTSAKEWLLWYFASQDMGISHTLSRRFFWGENILWKEDLLRLRVATVVLSGHDLLVDVDETWRYLTEGERMNKMPAGKYCTDGPPTVWDNADRTLRVICYDELDHGQVFETKKRREPIIRALKDLMGGVASR